jgi:hypothetical protein
MFPFLKERVIDSIKTLKVCLFVQANQMRAQRSKEHKGPKRRFYVCLVTEDTYTKLRFLTGTTTANQFHNVKLSTNQVSRYRNFYQSGPEPPQFQPNRLFLTRILAYQVLKNGNFDQLGFEGRGFRPIRFL